jgi:ornithine carbamoyltransferase
VLKDLLRTSDLSPADVTHLLDVAAAFRRDPFRQRFLLANDTVTLYFSKPSTRTRISFETAVARLGGVPVAVGASDLQLGRGETVEDTARVISRYSRAFVIRTFAQADVERFAAAASIPVVNALTDDHHPCQSLADLLTIRDHFGRLAGLRLAYVGDGNNVTHSLLEACALAGMDVTVATPPGFAPQADVVRIARAIAAARGRAMVTVGTDPVDAVAGADVVYTDTWTSMNHEPGSRAERARTFAPYRVDAALLAHAHREAVFLHCLPAHRGEEVSADVLDGPRSLVFDQAANRLHTSTAVLEALLGGELTGSGVREARRELAARA